MNVGMLPKGDGKIEEEETKVEAEKASENAMARVSREDMGARFPGSLVSLALLFHFEGH